MCLCVNSIQIILFKKYTNINKLMKNNNKTFFKWEYVREKLVAMVSIVFSNSLKIFWIWLEEVFSFICFSFGKYYYFHAWFFIFIRHVGFQNNLYEEGSFVSFLFGLGWVFAKININYFKKSRGLYANLWFQRILL